MPAIVALVASNFARPERPRAYGLVASAGAIAVAAGPPIGGLFTTYWAGRGGGARGALGGAGGLGVHPAHRRHPARGGRAARPGGHRAVRAGPGADRLWHPALGDVGLCPAQTRRTRVAGAVASDLAGPVRRGGAAGLHVVGDS